MNMKQMIKHYQQQTPVTDPGKHRAQYDRLRGLSIKEIVNVVGGISAHYEKDLIGSDIQLELARKQEIDTRYTESILDRIFELDQRPLDQARPLIDRFMGTCRDGAVLVCSILRHLGIAARIRYGFVHMFLDPKKPLAEHIIIEYWHPQKQSWRLCEPRLNDEMMDRHGIKGLDAANFPRDQFIFAPQAWRQVRMKRRDAIKFSDLTFKESYGLWKVRNIMMYDQASLLGFEPLMWDVWGYMVRAKQGMEPKWYFQLKVLDKLASLDLLEPTEWATYLRLCQRKRAIRVSRSVKSCSPVNGDYRIRIRHPQVTYA